jgi:hypothetical protein
MARQGKIRPGQSDTDEEVPGLAEDSEPRKPGDDLAETAVEVEIPPETTPDGTIPIAHDVWSRQFGGQADPEAGIFRVADKRFSIRHIAGSPLGLLISSLLWFLAGSTLLILAVILQDDYYVYPAPVLVPFAWFMCWRTWRRWKGRAMFADRLVETLDGPQLPDGPVTP